MSDWFSLEDGINLYRCEGDITVVQAAHGDQSKILIFEPATGGFRTDSMKTI